MIGEILHCATLDLPGLEPYRTLKRPLLHRQQGIFIAEGDKVARRFLESSFTAVSVLLSAEWFERYREIIERRPERIAVFIAEKERLETIVGFRCHQGIMAVGIVPPAAPMPAVLARSPRPRLFVAVDGLTSAENTGALVRNCAACSVQAFIAGETSADPYLRRAVRNSMGTVFGMPVVYAEKLTDTLRNLRQDERFTVLAAHPRADSIALHEADFTNDCCIVFGSEGEGVSDAVLRECGGAVTIPMASGVDSFNVACASAVVLYEATRQRAVQAPGSNAGKAARP